MLLKHTLIAIPLRNYSLVVEGQSVIKLSVLRCRRRVKGWLQGYSTKNIRDCITTSMLTSFIPEDSLSLGVPYQ